MRTEASGTICGGLEEVEALVKGARGTKKPLVGNEGKPRLSTWFNPLLGLQEEGTLAPGKALKVIQEMFFL